MNATGTDRDTQTFFTFEQTLRVLRRQALPIALAVVLVGAAAFAYSEHKKPRYTATASLIFTNNQLSQQVAGLQAVGSDVDPTSQQDTDVETTKLGDMAAITASRLGGGLTETKVDKSLSISAVGDTYVVDVAATSTSRELAAKIANTYSNVFVTEQETTNQQYYSSALALVEKQLAALSPQAKVGAAGLALEDRAQSLGVLAQLRSGSVELAQAAAVPTTPSSPKTARNIILGAVLGLFLGFGIAFLRERLDRRIRDPQDLEIVYGLPLIGVIAESSALARSRPDSPRTAAFLPSNDAEAFRLIRARLRFFGVDHEVRTLLIGSAAPGDGKTTISRHLAAAAASMGSRVLLLELDFRRPTVAKAFGIRPGPGVADILVGSNPTSAAIQSVTLGPLFAQNSDRRTFDVLVAGTLPPNPGELLESRAMEKLLAYLRSDYDFVVIDTPPLVAVSDAFPLLSRVDGVVIVARVGRNRRDIAGQLHKTLTAADAALLGVIANGVKVRARGAYGYGYGYAYGHKRSSDAPASSGHTPIDDPASITNA
jgi:capsular exopolysaccharide synthesis family protein